MDVSWSNLLQKLLQYRIFKNVLDVSRENIFRISSETSSDILTVLSPDLILQNVLTW